MIADLYARAIIFDHLNLKMNRSLESRGGFTLKTQEAEAPPLPSLPKIMYFVTGNASSRGQRMYSERLSRV